MQSEKALRHSILLVCQRSKNRAFACRSKVSRRRGTAPRWCMRLIFLFFVQSAQRTDQYGNGLKFKSGESFSRWFDCDLCFFPPPLGNRAIPVIFPRRLSSLFAVTKPCIHSESRRHLHLHAPLVFLGSLGCVWRRIFAG